MKSTKANKNYFYITSILLIMGLTLFKCAFPFRGYAQGGGNDNGCGDNDPSNDQGGDCGCGGGGGSCFTADTPILMADGSYKKIAAVRVGDQVVGWDEKAKKLVPQEVRRLETPIRDHYVTLSFAGGKTLNLTDDHRVYSQHGWAAIDPAAAMRHYGTSLKVTALTIGDRLLQSDGSWVTVTAMAYHRGNIKLYDLIDVSVTHNYFAGGVLVHNCADDNYYYEPPCDPCTGGDISCPSGYTATKGQGPNYLCGEGSETVGSECDGCSYIGHTCYRNCQPATTCQNASAASSPYGRYRARRDAGCGMYQWCLQSCPTLTTENACFPYPHTQLQKNPVGSKNDSQNFCQRCNQWSTAYVSGITDNNQGGYYQCWGGMDSPAIIYTPVYPDEPANSADTHAQADCTGASYTPPSATANDICHNNNEKCCALKTCKEISDLTGNGYDTEWLGKLQGSGQVTNADNYVFEPDMTTQAAGSGGHRCTKATQVSKPFFVVSNGNIYAQSTINNELKDGQYFIHADSICNDNSTAAAASAGLLFSGSGISSLDLLGSHPYKTQREQAATLAYPAFSVNGNLEENYEYFHGLVPAGSLPRCDESNWNSFKPSNDVPVCQVGSTTITDNNYAWVHDGSKSGVMFVAGDLTINLDTTKIVANPGVFKAFIVSGNIIVTTSVGTSPDKIASACATADDAHLQGIFIAKNVTFNKSTDLAQYDPWNRDARCDRQLIVAGTLAQWQGNLQLSRTFKGCVLKYNQLKDLNGTTPVYVFYYRPDFILNTPDWMKAIHSLRLETT